MSDIKFRARAANSLEWVYGYYAELHQPGYDRKRGHYIIYFDDNGAMYQMLVDPKTVGLYTGLKDKNVTEIYEGDVVKYKLGSLVVIGDVRWDNKLVQFVKRAEKVQGKFDYKALSSYLPSTEVIGNIHENPEFQEERVLP